MTEPLSREALVDMLLEARTVTEIEMALALAGRFMERHPEDADLSAMMEQPWLILQGLKTEA